MRFYNLDTALQHLAQAEELILHSEPFDQFPQAIFQLSRLKRLEISNCQLNIIPPEIAQLTSLESLSLPQNKLKVFPIALRQLNQLKKLDLSENEIEDIPDWIGSLSNLETLILAKNGLKAIPDELTNLTKLKKIDIRVNQIQKLPPSIGKLTELRELLVSKNLLRRLPKSIGKCTQIDYLDLTENQLNQLPDQIGELKQMRRLKLNNNRLKLLPDQLNNCQYLRDLSLQNNRLETLPENIGRLEWLAQLNCRKNNLDFLPDSIGLCQQLQELDASKNNLRQLPSTIGQLFRLADLNLSENKIQTLSELPESLKHLNLNKNQLQKLPKSIAQLTRLRRLYLANNQLVRLPNHLKSLGKLEQLFIQANPIDQEPDVLLYLDALKSIRGYQFYKASSLLKFIKACKKNEVPHSIRLNLYALYRGKNVSIKSMPLQDLFLSLRLNLPELDFPVRRYLFQDYSLSYDKTPLQAGSRLCVLGTTQFARKDLQERLSKLRVEYTTQLGTRVSHVLLGSRPTYDPRLENQIVFLSEKDLNDFFSQHEAQYLRKEKDPDKLAHIKQLLLHHEEDNVWLALQLLKGGGVPKSLLGILFYLSKSHVNHRIKSTIRSILVLNLSEESKVLVQREGNLSKSLSEETKRKKLEKLGEVEEFNRAELFQLFLKS